MKRYLVLGLLTLAACDDTGTAGLNYTAPAGYVLVTDPDKGNHFWERIEGNRVFFREISQYSGTDFGTFYIDYNCRNRTFRSEGEKRWEPVRNLAPDSIGRGAYWKICGS